jgi:hypothetical protein
VELLRNDEGDLSLLLSSSPPHLLSSTRLTCNTASAITTHIKTCIVNTCVTIHVPTAAIIAYTAMNSVFIVTFTACTTAATLTAWSKGLYIKTVIGASDSFGTIQQ